MNIHNYDLRYQQTVKRVQKANISERNKELIMRVTNDLVLEGLSKPRLIKYMGVLTIVAKMIQKDLDTADINDLKKIVTSIQQRGDYSPWTKQMYKVIIRRFYKWIAGTKTYPEIVQWISIRTSRSEMKLPSEGELLTEEDIQKLLRVTIHPRDKAFVSILWESGARISEIGNMKIGNIAFDVHGTVITVQGKTGSRKIRLLFSTQYLSTWLGSHPLKDNPEAPVWIDLGDNELLEYDGYRKMLQRIFQLAGIKKRCNPHIFRHSRATFMAHHLTEFQMNQYFGWIQGSDMPSTYVHMSGKNIEEALFKMNGISVEQKKEESKLIPIHCPRCDVLNSNENKFCCKCGGILDIKHSMELEEKRKQEQEVRTGADQLMNELLKDKDVQRLLMEKMVALRGSFSV